MTDQTMLTTFDSLVALYDFTRIESLLNEFGSEECVFKNECWRFNKIGIEAVITMALVLKIAFKKYARQKIGNDILNQVTS